VEGGLIPVSEEPTVRSAEPDDAERLREVARSSFTASYAMSPDEIEGIVEEEFGEEALREEVETAEIGPFVAEVDGVLAGFVDVASDGDLSTIRWLHVDPERRGLGAGTALFERAVSEIEDRGGEPRAITLSANTSSGAFFERMEFERVEERGTELAGVDVVEYVYAEVGTEEPADSGSATSEEADGDAESTPDIEDVDLPEEIPADENEDGDGTVYPGGELIDGAEGPFVATYSDEDRTEEYGYYCVNCGSTDVSMDSMDRIRCENCGNTFQPGETYDASYL
jgi:ribosomal protein S18 acetylase RimI-like enzyme